MKDKLNKTLEPYVPMMIAIGAIAVVLILIAIR